MERYASLTRLQIAGLRLSPDLQKRLVKTMEAAIEKKWQWPKYWRSVGETLWGFHARRELGQDVNPKGIEILAKRLWRNLMAKARRRRNRKG